MKYAGGLAAVAGMPSMAFSLKANASIYNPKKLVILTLAGGNDGLNTVIPLDDERHALYQQYRTHATDPGQSIAIPWENVLPFGEDVNGTPLGLHPAMQSLWQYKDNLAIFPTAHTGPGSNRSHFFQVDLIDAGLHTEVTDIQDGRGWMGRYLESKYSASHQGIVAQDFAAGAGLFKGDTFVFAVSNPQNLDLGAGSASASDAVWNDIARVQDSSQLIGNARSYALKQESLFEVVGRVRSTVNFNREPFLVNNSYPADRRNLGRNFKRAADMLSTLPELEVVHIVHGGYDTHKNQGGVEGYHAGLLKDMSDSLAAFYEDLAYLGLSGDVVVIVKTEFGRTLRQNNDGGTDHGQATSWMAFGGQVQGGVYGEYPDLGFEPAGNQNALYPTVDYRDIVSEVLGTKFLGAGSPGGFFPGYGVSQYPLNFIA